MKFVIKIKIKYVIILIKSHLQFIVIAQILAQKGRSKVPTAQFLHNFISVGEDTGRVCIPVLRGPTRRHLDCDKHSLNQSRRPIKTTTRPRLIQTCQSLSRIFLSWLSVLTTHFLNRCAVRCPLTLPPGRGREMLNWQSGPDQVRNAGIFGCYLPWILVFFSPLWSSVATQHGHFGVLLLLRDPCRNMPVQELMGAAC